MKIGNETNLPPGLEELHGLWYMNGNKIRDEVMSFAGATPWGNATNVWELKVYDERIWTFSNSIRGRLLYARIRQSGFTWRIRKLNDGRFRFKPVFKLPAYLLSVTFPINRLISTFVLEKSPDEDYWISDRYWLGLIKGHRFRLARIVDGKGQRTVKYETDYLYNRGAAWFSRSGLKQTQLMALAEPYEAIKLDLDESGNESILIGHTGNSTLTTLRNWISRLSSNVTDSSNSNQEDITSIAEDQGLTSVNEDEEDVTLSLLNDEVFFDAQEQEQAPEQQLGLE